MSLKNSLILTKLTKNLYEYDIDDQNFDGFDDKESEAIISAAYDFITNEKADAAFVNEVKARFSFSKRRQMLEDAMFNLLKRYEQSYNRGGGSLGTALNRLKKVFAR